MVPLDIGRRMRSSGSGQRTSAPAKSVRAGRTAQFPMCCKWKSVPIEVGPGGREHSAPEQGTCRSRRGDGGSIVTLDVDVSLSTARPISICDGGRPVWT